MYIATVEKINGNWKVLNFLNINNLEENIFENYVQCDDTTKYFYFSLIKKYKNIYIKEEDVQIKGINTDSFIYSEAYDLDTDKLTLEKTKLIKDIDFDMNMNLKGINFMEYINYIYLFNYFASKGIFITKENKEDKYIEILELNDEEAIEKLEEYLMIQDSINPFLENIKEINKIKEDITYANTIEDLDLIKSKL